MRLSGELIEHMWEEYLLVDGWNYQTGWHRLLFVQGYLEPVLAPLCDDPAGGRRSAGGLRVSQGRFRNSMAGPVAAAPMWALGYAGAP